MNMIDILMNETSKQTKAKRKAVGATTQAARDARTKTTRDVDFKRDKFAFGGAPLPGSVSGQYDMGAYGSYFDDTHFPTDVLGTQSDDDIDRNYDDEFKRADGQVTAADIAGGKKGAAKKSTDPLMARQATYTAKDALNRRLPLGLGKVISTPSKTRAGSIRAAAKNKVDPAYRSNLQWQGPTAKGTPAQSPVPVQVQQAASKEAGGKVVFGRYYDAQGNYLGRSQGGKWVDASSDPNAKTQMEMYQKLMEIKSGHYSPKDKEMVKKMIREVMKSCK
jgi:hypothetical protein